jgi:hypothetical protein
VARVPVAFALTDVEQEIGQDLAAVLRVHYLGVKLDAVYPARIVGYRGDRAGIGATQDAESRGRLLDGVAVTHPDLLASGRIPE